VLAYLGLEVFAAFFIMYDFWFWQHHIVQWYGPVEVGVALICLGGVLRMVSRFTLKKAGFTILNSVKLQIVGDQKLITDGIYGRIRHPLYLGEMTRNIGFAVLLSSWYGLGLVVVANLFLVVRIPREERMLVEAFGDEYKEYRKKTKRLVPYIY
jgi:protein-S-isoprenylcysteine O-methyltransferase Ste14